MARREYIFESSLASEPFLIWDEEKKSNRGFVVDLVSELMKTMNISSSSYTIRAEDIKSGSGFSIRNAEPDAKFFVKMDETNAVWDPYTEFAPPLLTTGVIGVGWDPPISYASVPWGALFQPFSIASWMLLILGLIILILVTAFVCKNKTHHDIWYTGQLIGLVATVIIWCIFVISLYTSGLIGITSDKPQDTSPTDIIDLVFNRPSVKLGATESVSKALKSSKIPSMIHIYNRIQHDGMEVKGDQEGIALVRRSMGTFVYLLYEYEANYLINNQPCNLKLIGNRINDVQYAIQLPANSNLRAPLNKAILKLQGDGTFKILQRRWWPNFCFIQQSQNVQSRTIWGIGNVLVPFFLLLAGLAIVVLLVFLQRIFQKNKDSFEPGVPLVSTSFKPKRAEK